MVCFFWKSEETMKELFAALLEEDTMKRALLSVELYCFPTLTLERVLEIAKNKEAATPFCLFASSKRGIQSCLLV